MTVNVWFQTIFKTDQCYSLPGEDWWSQVSPDPILEVVDVRGLIPDTDKSVFTIFFPSLSSVLGLDNFGGLKEKWSCYFLFIKKTFRKMLQLRIDYGKVGSVFLPSSILEIISGFYGRPKHLTSSHRTQQHLII